MRIAELLFARDQHLTAEQIIQTLAEAGTQVSKATVYNTLNLFAGKGLLKAHAGRPGSRGVRLEHAARTTTSTWRTRAS